MKRRKKRRYPSFARRLTGSIAAALIVSGIFAGGLFEYGRSYIFTQTQKLMQEHHSVILSSMAGPEADTGKLNMMLRAWGEYAVAVAGGHIQLVSGLTPGCTSTHLVCDPDGRIVWSGERALMALLKDDEKVYRGFVQCDTGGTVIPELDAAEKAYAAYYAQADANTYPQVTIDSAWVEPQTHRFLPRSITVSQMHLLAGNGEALGEEEVLEEQHFTIPDPGWDGFTLVEFEEGDIHVSPRIMLDNFYGTPPEEYAALLEAPYVSELLTDDSTGGTGGFWGGSSTSNYYYERSPIYVDGTAYRLLSIYRVEAWNSHTKPLYFTLVGAFTMLALLIAAVAARLRYLREKADADFAAYQRALTNDLAHDLKTPLMAIGGYAENAMAKPENAQRYLEGILRNVSYTDAIISRTLELGALEEIRKPLREKVSLHPVAEELLEKYACLLDEQDITVGIEGEAQVTADPQLLRTALENLLSNAVRYTPRGGTIKLTMAPGTCTVTNTVENRVETQDLCRPFKKGDAARSGRQGSGLGLSIARAAMDGCGGDLVLSCTDTAFTAVLRF
ncbi:MAG: HAMP domain-containing histidine kinase [Oscillospiraceae bacterium]|nr:HAMP domain-containing histidine kinase [Oscillospiraceae bacterium]